MRFYSLLVMFLSFPLVANASFWEDLWLTKNQQAQKLMDKHQYSAAASRFEDEHWRVTADYRAGQYEKAASGYQAFNTADGFYNQGNALAHMGRYEDALKAYDKALGLNSNHQDALYNRKIIEALLNKDKQKQNQNKQNQDKQNQNKQNQDKQNQDKQNQDKQNQNKQNQDKQNQDKQNQDKQNQDKQNQDKQNQDKQNQDKQNQDKQNQDKQNQDKQNQDKQNQDKQNQDKQNQDKLNQDKQNADLSPEESEMQRANEQWLRLVPDDPGGLMREKFLRDHLRRQNGWEQ